MNNSSDTQGGCVERLPVEVDAEDVFVHDCRKAEGGDMAAKPPQPYVLSVLNLPDENA